MARAACLAADVRKAEVADVRATPSEIAGLDMRKVSAPSFAVASRLIWWRRRRYRRDQRSSATGLTRYRNVAAELLSSFAHAAQAM